MPKIIIIAGPNDAGKTTFAREFLPTEAKTLNFINADLIALGLVPFSSGSVAVRAARLMLEKLINTLAKGEVLRLERLYLG